MATGAAAGAAAYLRSPEFRTYLMRCDACLVGHCPAGEGPDGLVSGGAARYAWDATQAVSDGTDQWVGCGRRGRCVGWACSTFGAQVRCCPLPHVRDPAA
jgi:hypothetical protein